MEMHEIHCIEYVWTDRTYCGLDHEQVLVAAEDPLDLRDGVTCEACLAAIEEEEEKEEVTSL